MFLVSASQREESLARLAAMESTDDGFELAAFDLSLRREGDILGNRQHGASGLKLVNIMRDGAVIRPPAPTPRLFWKWIPTWEEPDHVALAREVRLAFAHRIRHRRRLIMRTSPESSGATVGRPKGDGTRPTTDRVRRVAQSAPRFPARRPRRRGGAGRLRGFRGPVLEALSRGADTAVLCRARPGRRRRHPERNISALRLGRDRARLVRGDVLKRGAAAPGRPFDLVFLDPPYATDPAGDLRPPRPPWRRRRPG